jgi:asparaginyl-tRNA synthetase
MNRLLIKNVLDDPSLGQQTTVCGWVRTYRKSRNVAFIVINDGSTQDNLQLVIPSESSAFTELDDISTGAAISAEGTIIESPAKGQKYELDVANIKIIGKADPETYPLQKKGHTLEFLREIEHLRPRSNTSGAVFRIRNTLAHATHEFFQDRNFHWIHTPIITGSDCEGAGELFAVTTLDMLNIPKDSAGEIDYSQDFFGDKAYLTVSGQLEAEFLSMALGNVYTFGPTFRAENSNTTRHMSEFWMVEPEIAFADLNDDIDLAVDLIKYLCKIVTERGDKELSFFEKHYKGTSIDNLRALSESTFTHITYTDAVKELLASKIKFDFPIEWGLDLQTEHERYLTEEIYKGPVVVTDYPKDIKPFYMRINDDEKTVAAMDVLVPQVGEIIGGSQREERHPFLKKRMEQLGVSLDSYQWYLDLRIFGSAPGAGFGLGFDRFVQYVTGMKNIRDVIPCPRTPHSFK